MNSLVFIRILEPGSSSDILKIILVNVDIGFILELTSFFT